MHRRHVLAAAIALLAASPSLADDDRDDLERAQRGGEVLPLSAILNGAHGTIDGRVVDIEFDYDNGQATYEIYWIDASGRRRETEIDARTGAILKTETDD